MIYRWNGADERNMGKFEEDFKPKRFRLRNNWRSTKKIVDLLENLYQDNLVPKNDKEGKVRLRRFWKEAQEAREAKNICYELGQDHLILARTNKQLAAIATKEPDLYKDFKFKSQTIHKSKGGSAETVVVLGCGGKYIPYYKSEDIEEEKNLLYVACSRAKTNLFLLNTGYPSYFLEGVLN
jgi:superfamily I DNA/RNA helicase